MKNIDVLKQLKDLGNLELNAENVLITDATNNFTSTNVEGALKELHDEQESLKQSVVSGKTVVASAISDKGVPTLATDSFDTMASNITSIKGFPPGWDVEKSGKIISQDAKEGDAGVWMLGGKLEDMPDETLVGEYNVPIRRGYCCKVRKHTNGKTYLYVIDSSRYLTIFELVDGAWLKKAEQIQASYNETYQQLDVTPDGELIAISGYASSSSVKRLKTWNGEVIQDVGSLTQSSSNSISGTALSPKKDVYVIGVNTSSANGAIVKLDSNYNNISSTTYIDGIGLNGLTSCAFSKNGEWLVITKYGTASNNVSIFKRNETKEYNYEVVQHYTPKKGLYAYSCAISDDGSTIALGFVDTNVTLEILKRNSDDLYYALNVPNGSIGTAMITLSPNGTKVMAGHSNDSTKNVDIYTIYGDEVKVYNSTGTCCIGYGDWINEEECVLPTQNTYVRSYRFDSEPITSFNVEPIFRIPINIFSNSNEKCGGLSFSDDGKYMLFSYFTGTGTRLYDFAIFKKIPERNAYYLSYLLPAMSSSGDPGGATISPNGDYVIMPRAAGSSINAYKIIHDTTTVVECTRPPARTSSIKPLQVSWSPDSRFVAMAEISCPNSIDLYRREGDTFVKINSPITSSNGRGVNFSYDGKYMVVVRASSATAIDVAKYDPNTDSYVLAFSPTDGVSGVRREIIFIGNTYKFIVNLANANVKSVMCEINPIDDTMSVVNDKLGDIIFRGVTSDGAYGYGTLTTSSNNNLYYSDFELHSIDMANNTTSRLWSRQHRLNSEYSKISPNSGSLFITHAGTNGTSGAGIYDYLASYEVMTEPRVIPYSTLNLPLYRHSQQSIGVITKGGVVGETATLNTFPKLTLGGAQQMLERIQMLENKVKSLEDNDKAVLSGDMQTLASNLYPEDFSDEVQP